MFEFYHVKNKDGILGRNVGIVRKLLLRYSSVTDKVIKGLEVVLIPSLPNSCVAVPFSLTYHHPFVRTIDK